MSSTSTNPYGHYVPSKVAAVVGSIVFAVLVALQLWKIVASRKWFGLAIVVGGIFEAVGLAARAYTRDHLSEKTPYIVQILLILLAPILFAASVYMFLGRLIYASGHPQLSFIRINWLTKIFVCGDIFCFLIQAAGAGKLVNADTTDEISSAQAIILGGLGLQVFFFCIFAICAVVFHIRISATRFAESIDATLRLNSMLFSLYICSLLITVRNIYRLIEYKSGTDGYLQQHEWPTYGLDVILMAIIMVITVFWYTAEKKTEHHSSFPLMSRDGST
ncbi:hypothetical protein G7Z17_g1275 [Cylindrodendrum hubeiense]|uniref:RTA1 like protein n=1 Tax=Cylindrodendrum hubeiense TaxID=595255 RepID=A0A9P5HNA7_9HYPO|nr:hypothetical protein G7Z17_g1275 [Cylindrodendrum hubeiense]